MESSEDHQRQNWELTKKKICGQVNRVHVRNIVRVIRDLFKVNLIRARGILVRIIMKAQSLSPSFSHLYAALIAVINSKFPAIGELQVRRLIIQLQGFLRRDDISSCLIPCKFLSHLFNQRVVHESVVLEILLLLLREPRDDSIEVAVSMLKECGATLELLSPDGARAAFDQLRSVLNDCDAITRKTQFMIEGLMYVRKMKYKDYRPILEDLDLVEEEDQVTHTIEVNPESAEDNKLDPEIELNVFAYDPDFEETERKYAEISQSILGEDDEEDEAAAEEVVATQDESDQTAEGTVTKDEAAPKLTIIDKTESEMVEFRKRVYLTIQSSLSYEEAAHKLIKNELRRGLEDELCHMIMDCCAQTRAYDRFYGLLAERFCRLRREFQSSFEDIARDLYNTIHRLDMTKLRIMAKFVAHLLSSDAISWDVLEEIKLNERDTTSSSRIYTKILFQELAEIMSLQKIYERMNDPSLERAFAGIFPRDNSKNMKFAINFFSLIGLGGITIDLRKRLAKVEKQEEAKRKKKEEEEENASSSDTGSTSSSSSTSSVSS